jgi:hypothetical protein
MMTMKRVNSANSSLSIEPSPSESKSRENSGAAASACGGAFVPLSGEER